MKARGAFQAAAARPLYNLSFSVETQHTYENRHYLGLRQRIDLVDKRSARTAAAAADRLAVHADYIFTRRAVTADLLSGLAGYQTGIERDALATKRVRLMQDFAALTKRRFEAGDTVRVEFNLAVLVFADARMQQATVRTMLIDARQQVTNLIPPDISTPWPALETGLPALPAQDDLESLLTALPEVRAAQRRVDSAKAVIALRKRQKVLDPTIGVTGGGEAGESLVGVNLVVPLPLRNPFRYEVTAAYRQYQQAQQTVNDVMRRARPPRQRIRALQDRPRRLAGLAAPRAGQRSATGRPYPSPVAIRRTQRHGIPGRNQLDHRQPGRRPSTASSAVACLV